MIVNFSWLLRFLDIFYFSMILFVKIFSINNLFILFEKIFGSNDFSVFERLKIFSYYELVEVNAATASNALKVETIFIF